MSAQVTEWLVGYWLFEANREKLWSWEEDHLAWMTEALEARFDTEPEFLAGCKNRDQYFKPDGLSRCLANHSKLTFVRVHRVVCTLQEAPRADMASAEAAERGLRARRRRRG